jgi:hypothetical protein
VNPEGSNLIDPATAIIKVAHILNGKDEYGNNLPVGPVNMRSNRYLILLYLATVSPRHTSLGKIYGERIYFSAPNLKKIAKSLYIPLNFDRQRCIEDVYSIHSKQNLVEIRTENNYRRISLTDLGITKCLDILRDLIITNFPEEKDQFFSKGSSKVYSITDNNILSLDVYLKRRDIIPLFEKYPVFYGRRNEMELIENFLNDKRKQILFITGEGGIGKTRLVLETLKQRNTINHPQDWNVFFLNPYGKLLDLPNRNKVLIVLDDAKRYSEVIHIVLDMVINPPTGHEIKMLIIERNIFADEIQGYIRQKNGELQMLTLSAGDLSSFLMGNFMMMDEETSNEIASKCHGNFDYAAFCAEYRNNGGKISEDLMSIISWKIEKYIENIAQRTGINNADIKFYLKILSIISPFDWVYEAQFVKNSLNNFDQFMNILFDSKSRYENNIIFSEDSLYFMKPDPVADYFKLIALEDDKFKNILIDLMKYFPYRIIYHIASVRKTNYQQTRNYVMILGESWLLLNKIEAITQEYFEAIDALSYILTIWDNSSTNVIQMNPRKWIESFEQSFIQEPPTEIKNNLLRSLFNAYVYYNDKDLSEYCSRILDYFNRLFHKYNDKDFELIQAICLEVRCDHYIKENAIDKLNRSVLIIRQLYRKYPSDLDSVLATVLVKSLLFYKTHNIMNASQRIYKYTDELKSLFNQNPTQKMAIIWCAGLVVAIEIYLTNKLFNKALYEYSLVKSIFDKYPIEKIENYLASITRNMKYLISKDEDYRNKGLETVISEGIYKPAPLEFSQIKKSSQRSEMIVDYEVHQIVYDGIFVFVLSNEVLPSMNASTDLMVQDHFKDMHVFISIKYQKDSDGGLLLIICPNRISNDLSLSRMVRYMDKSTTDSLTGDLINEATIGIANQKCYDILRNPSLTDDEKYKLMISNDCEYQAVSKGFPTISLLLSFMQDPEFSDLYRKVDYCLYCNKNYD